MSSLLPRTPGEIVYALLVAGMLSGMLLSVPLWMTGRGFPHLPLIPFIQPFPAPLDAIFFWITFFLLALSVFSRRNRWGAIGCCVLLALQDQVRWQPWFYQYLLLMTAGMILQDRSAPSFLFVCRIFLICLYFWSGVHKLNAGYANLYEATFVQPLSSLWPGWAAEAVRRAGPVSPWLEIATAVALCFRPTRRWGIAAAILTHVAILIMIGPPGTFRNTVIWPWNLIMPALAVILFRRAPELGWKSVDGPRPRIAAALIILCAGVFPAFSFNESWDRYLSFKLYAGDERRLVLVVDEQASKALPESWWVHLRKSTHHPDAWELGFLEWALEELNVPGPADDRHLLTLAKKCARMKFASAGRVLFYIDYPFRMQERGWLTLTPEEILKLRAFPPLQKPAGSPQ